MQTIIECFTYIYLALCYKKKEHQEQPLIELSNINTLSPQPSPTKPSISQLQLSSPNKSSPGKDEMSRLTIRQYEKNSFMEEQFQSIDSYYNNNPDISFNMIPYESTIKVNKLRKENLFGGDIKFLQVESFEQRKEMMKYNSSRWGQFNNDYSFSLKEEAEDMLSWMQRAYLFEKNNKKIRICYAIRLKVQGKEMLKLLVHKLEDFRIFYLTESRETHFNYQNTQKTFYADFKINQLGSSSIKGSKIMSFYRIQCSTINIGKLLQIFKSEEIFKILHQFQNIKIVNNNGMGMNLQFPVLQVQEMGYKIKGDKLFHLGFQLGQMEFKEQVGNKQLLEIVYSLDQGERSFQRILKIYQSQKGSIELYSQSSEQVICSYELYFHSKFKALNQYLISNSIIPKS